MMAPKPRWFLAWALAGVVAGGLLGQAQQHRATRLGHPSTRFDTPLTRPEQLRTLLAGEAMRADVLSILRQAGWPGEVEDLRRAAANAPIREWKLPPGTRMPFMSSREEGRPVTLKDVLWAGDEPVEAYAFDFVSRGRQYRCITPKPCSNFYVEDLGPVVPPAPRTALTLTLTGPPEASRCEPFEVRLAVMNSGNQTLSQVRVVELLPAGCTAGDGRSRLELDAGTLPPGQGREFRFRVVATAPGPCEHRAEAVAAGEVRAEAQSRTVVLAPELELTCQSPEEVRIGRNVEVVLALRNPGTAPEPLADLALPVPSGASFVSATGGGGLTDGRVVWPGELLAPGAVREVRAVFQPAAPGTLELAPVANGGCAGPVANRCTTRVAGIPAVLLETVDLLDPVGVGEEVIYEIRVTNQGSAPGTGIRLVALLPAAQEFMRGSGASAVTAEGRLVRTEPLPLLEAKAQATWRFTVRALTAGDIRFQVDLTSDQFPQPIVEFEATTQY